MKTEKRSVWLVGGHLLTIDDRWSEFPNSALEMTGGKITWVGARSEARIPQEAEVIDCSGCLVLPGLINTHTHTGMSYLRGAADDLPLKRWLHEGVFPLERELSTPEMVKLSNELAALEFIRSGTTTFADMYYFQDVAAEAIHRSGLRMVAGTALIDIGGLSDPLKVRDDLEAFFSAVSIYPRIVPSVAPHSAYGLGENLWKHVIDFASRKDCLVQVHLAESQDEEREIREKFGKSGTALLESYGLWEQCRVLAAHCVELSPKEIALLGSYKVGIAHNCESNLKLGNRICPVVELRAAGAIVGIGTDSVASNNNLDLLQEADFVSKLQSLKYGPGKLKAREVVAMLTREGAAAVGLGNQLGTLEVGKQADVIVVDASGPNATPLFDPYSHLVFSAVGADVRDVIVGGNPVMRDQEFLTLDAAGILDRVRAVTPKIRNLLPATSVRRPI